MDRVEEKIVNYDLIEDLLSTLLLHPSSAKIKLSFPQSDDDNEESVEVDGATLIFLPGLGEIRALTDRLRSNRHFSKRDAFEIIPLHSTISPRDQKRAFVNPKRGCRKIIISTNIAETSITIPDVVCGKLMGYFLSYLPPKTELAIDPKPEYTYHSHQHESIIHDYRSGCFHMNFNNLQLAHDDTAHSS